MTMGSARLDLDRERERLIVHAQGIVRALAWAGAYALTMIVSHGAMETIRPPSPPVATIMLSSALSAPNGRAPIVKLDCASATAILVLFRRRRVLDDRKTNPAGRSNRRAARQADGQARHWDRPSRGTARRDCRSGSLTRTAFCGVLAIVSVSLGLSGALSSGALQSVSSFRSFANTSRKASSLGDAAGRSRRRPRRQGSSDAGADCSRARRPWIG